MKKLTVNAMSATYDILIEKGILKDCAKFIADVVRGKKAMIVTDTNVAPLYLDKVKEELEELRKAAELETKLKEITDGMMFELNHGDDAETMEFVMGKKVVSVPINEISYNFLFEHFEKLLIELQEYYK